MTHFLTNPSDKHAPAVLHRDGCPNVRGNARRILVSDWIMAPRIMPNRINTFPACPACLADHAEARAEAWLTIIENNRRILVEQRAAEARNRRQAAARADFLVQIEPVRIACEATWGRPVTFASFNWAGNVALELHREDGHRPGTIYLTATEGERRLRFDDFNHSTGLIRTMTDAHRLSAVFTIIAGWVAPTPLHIPADFSDVA